MKSEQNGGGARRTARALGATVLGVLACVAAAGVTGCAPAIGGRASFPILSKAPLPGYAPVTTIDEKRCSHVVLFFAGWGEDSNHEALITDVLEKHKGDAIVDADLTFFSIPAFFYNQNCARVRGTVVRRVAEAPAPAGAPAAPVGPPPVQPAQPAQPVSLREVAR
jgi:hypothetical protein